MVFNSWKMFNRITAGAVLVAGVKRSFFRHAQAQMSCFRMFINYKKNHCVVRALLYALYVFLLLLLSKAVIYELGQHNNTCRCHRRDVFFLPSTPFI